MSRRQQKLCVLSAVFFAVCLFLTVRHFSAGKEPRYHGKTLTKWLKQLDDGEAFGISSSRLPDRTGQQLEAAEAIHAIGTNALPFLMAELQARPSEKSSRIRFYRWSSQHLPEGLHSLLFSRLDTTEEDRRRWRAAQGLSALGPLAEPAMPELKFLLLTNMWHSSIKESAYALAAIGPKGVEILTNSVTPTTEWSGMCAIWALGQHPAVGTNYIPFLIQNTTSSSQGTAEGAIEVLGLFHMDAEHVVPALTNVLASGKLNLTERAVNALGNFGPRAAAALPMLETMTNNPVSRSRALDAIQKIRSRQRETH